MSANQSINLEHLEGRTFILGREGHIYIDSPTASKHHAEIRIRRGRIFLRDLESTNGTFLVKNQNVVQFLEGYVNPLQRVVIGSQTYVIQDLLSIACDFVSVDDNETVVELSEDLNQQRQYG